MIIVLNNKTTQMQVVPSKVAGDVQYGLRIQLLVEGIRDFPQLVIALTTAKRDLSLLAL